MTTKRKPDDECRQTKAKDCKIRRVNSLYENFARTERVMKLRDDAAPRIDFRKTFEVFPI